MKIDKHIYSYDTIVIGGGLNALLYSFFTGYPCIFVKPDPPFRFDVCDEEHDFGFLILEWSPEENNTWIGTWVDTEDELNNYKYKRDGSNFVNLPAIVRIFAEYMAQVHHKQMMKQAEQEDDWRNWDRLQNSDPKPYLN